MELAKGQVESNHIQLPSATRFHTPQATVIVKVSIFDCCRWPISAFVNRDARILGSFPTPLLETVVAALGLSPEMTGMTGMSSGVTKC